MPHWPSLLAVVSRHQGDLSRPEIAESECEKVRSFVDAHKHRYAQSSRLEKLCTLLALGVGTSSLSIAQWNLDPPGYPFNYVSAGAVDSNAGPIHHNNSNSAIVIEGSYSYTRYDLVSGAAQSTPPNWSAAFATLFNNSDFVVREYANTLDKQKSGRVFDKLVTSEGSETWTNGSDVLIRERRVWTTAKIKYLKTWVYGTPEPGGN